MKTIFDKTEINDLKLKNRLFRSATWEALADENGHFDEEIYRIYDELSAGGVGCIISGFISVSDNDRYFGGMARLSNDGLIAEHKRLTDIVHAYDVLIIVQLALGEYQNKEFSELTDSDIDTIREMFIKAADRAVLAGYNGVQIHAAHGFFLSRYISPAHNRRANPEQLIIEIAKAIRANGRLSSQVQQKTSAGDDANFTPQIDPEAAEIVRSIFKLRASGWNVTRIAETLNSEDILPPQDYKYSKLGKDAPQYSHHLWSPTAVKCILTLFNEWHASSTSKKIKAVVEANAKAGKYGCKQAAYGYIKGDDEKHTPIINPKTAPVVLSIFKMRAQGISPRHIADKLNEDGILNPTDYHYSRIGKEPTIAMRHLWSGATVKNILQNRIYLGQLAQLRRTTVSHIYYKFLDKPVEHSLYNLYE
ncbi:MAG: recombinase family protein [Ruminococcus sp.]|nr:recombinase family protein [Ruminococcus sp.]